jgi:lipoate---protein ligase
VWRVEVSTGSPADFHARPMPDVIEPTAWWFAVTSSALVLGSSQRVEQIDSSACARAGIDIVRRRSGGGAVLLQPGDAMWVDVLLPASDPRWINDIGQSACWLGDVWQAALISIGVEGTSVHRRPLVKTAWSDHVCFAGIGGGEVVRDARKVVGISQRRTRAGARFQCALYLHWRPEAHVPLFSPPGPTLADLENLAVEVDATPEAVMSAFNAALDNN